jgi:hypothetical protein
VLAVPGLPATVNKLKSAISPWGTRDWSQFCFAKLLLAHAAWIEAEILLAQPKDWSG